MLFGRHMDRAESLEHAIELNAKLLLFFKKHPFIKYLVRLLILCVVVMLVGVLVGLVGLVGLTIYF